MDGIELDTTYPCHDGHARRVARDRGDGTVTWLMENPPPIADAVAGTCTRHEFAAMVAWQPGEARAGAAG